ncbi:MAG: CHAD domain-containing protein [Proteobacteria bacterium]|nr:CHAD domain-containing protein [Pseudomonadota bacterium]
MSLDPTTSTYQTDITDAVAKPLSKARDSAHSLLKDQSWRHSSNAVHDLRVALRRLNVASTALAEVLPKKMRRKLKRRIRELRRSAGQIRDDDVFHDAVTDLANQNSTYAVAAEIVRKKLKQSRTQLLKDLRHAIERQEKDTFWDWAEKQLLSRLGAKQVPKSLLHRIALDTISSKLSKLDSSMSVARANQDSDLHTVRIAAKGLRYTLELFSDCLESMPAAELRPVMINLQDLLGHIHDATIFASRCASWAKDPKLSPGERAELKKMATAFRDRRYHWITLDQ